MKTTLIANELRLTYHKNEELSKTNFSSLNTPYRLCEAFRTIWNSEIEIRESFYALFLNTRLNTVGYTKISDGGRDHVLVDIRHLMSFAILSNATQIAVAHNHPSGVVYPSEADKDLTKRINSAAKILGVKLLDHIIISTDSFYSFRELGDL